MVWADGAGCDTVWVSGRLDALTQLALAGTSTEGIESGTAIVPTFPRHPHGLAQQALSVQLGCRGSLVLGVG